MTVETQNRASHINPSTEDSPAAARDINQLTFDAQNRPSHMFSSTREALGCTPNMKGIMLGARICASCMFFLNLRRPRDQQT
jgi:hypothetical protein